MKGMNKISRGAGFRGVVAYCLTGEDREIGHGKILGGTMAAATIDGLAMEFKAIAAQRPDILKPVWHSSLRMPAGEDVSDDAWRAITDDYLEAMGIDKKNAQILIVKHDAEHVHIVLNRVLLDGKVFLGQNENLKNTKVIQALEKAHGLTITKGPNLDADGKIIMPENRAITKNEVEKAVRTESAPARERLQAIVNAAMSGRPTVTQLIERIEAAGASVLPNIASTGRMNGFAFSIDGVSFSGSKLGDKYKWSQLIKEIDYDEARDNKTLTARRDAAFGDRADDSPAGSAERSDRPDERASGSDRAPDAASVPDAANAPVDRTPAADDRLSAPARPKQEADTARVAASIASDREAGRSIAVVAEAIGQAAAPAISKDLTAKIQAWRQQSGALDAQSYRVALVDRIKRNGQDRSHRFGQRAGETEEKFYSAGEVEESIPKLRALNARGFDVYVTPFHKRFNYLLIDDVREKSLEKVKSLGYAPALIQQTSSDNYQVVIKAEMFEHADAPIVAKRFVSEINKLEIAPGVSLGDTKVTNGAQPFRMAGFTNKKHNRDSAFTRIVLAINRVCAIASRRLRDMLTEEDTKKKAEVDKGKIAARVAIINDETRHDPAGARRAYQQAARWMIKGQTKIDWSKVDFGVACEMIKDNHRRGQIEDAIREGSPDLSMRHPRNATEKYIVRTVDAAYAAVGSGGGSKKLEKKD